MYNQTSEITEPNSTDLSFEEPETNTAFSSELYFIEDELSIEAAKRRSKDDDEDDFDDDEKDDYFDEEEDDNPLTKNPMRMTLMRNFRLMTMMIYLTMTMRLLTIDQAKGVTATP